MPKVDYEKQPFRLCRWNSNSHGSKDGEYWCSYGEGSVDEDYCMKCFLNGWFTMCYKCKKLILKTDLVQVFLPEFKMGYVCKDCYDNEELVDRRLHIDEENIIYNINKWKKLNKEE